MNRHAFRSVCSRTRPELEQASDALRNYARQFHATQLQAVDNDGPNSSQPKPTPSLRERTRAATSEINSMTRGRRSGPATAQSPFGAPGQKPKVIDVRSLPRAPRGLGGMRGRGGFAGRGGVSGAGSNRSASPARTGPFTRAPGSPRGGGFRGRGRGGGGGGVARGRPKRRQDESVDKEKDKKRGVDPFSQLDLDEQAFDDAIRFGVRSRYNPGLTLDSIADFAPAMPSTSTGQTSTVLQNLSVLGTADHVGTPQFVQTRHSAVETEQNGLRFFADVKDKDAAKQHLEAKQETGEKAEGVTISDAEEAVRKVVMQRAVQGQHEAPEFASDPVGVSRSWHLRAETYTTRDVNNFEMKLASLLSGKRAVKGGGQARA